MKPSGPAEAAISVLELESRGRGMRIIKDVFDEVLDAVDTIVSSKCVLYVVISIASWFLGLACGIALEGWVW